MLSRPDVSNYLSTAHSQAALVGSPHRKAELSNVERARRASDLERWRMRGSGWAHRLRRPHCIHGKWSVSHEGVAEPNVLRGLSLPPPLSPFSGS